MEKYRQQIGIGLGTLVGLILGWWHGFAGWPVWAALPFLAGLGALIGYQAVSGERRRLVWLLFWILPGALIGFAAGVIGKAEPVGLLHLALEYAIYAAVIGLLGPENGRAGVLLGGLLVGVLGLADSLLGEVPDILLSGGVQFSAPTRLQYAFLHTLQTMAIGAVLGALVEYAIRSLRRKEA
jgi:hypothetical protein